MEAAVVHLRFPCMNAVGCSHFGRESSELRPVRHQELVEILGICHRMSNAEIERHAAPQVQPKALYPKLIDSLRRATKTTPRVRSNAS
jgi:hypothetical protein